MDPIGMLIAIVVMALFGFYIGWLGGKAQGRAESPRQEVTAEMVREALAHVEFGQTAPDEWESIAARINLALTEPNTVCPCCNVTMAGDIAWWTYDDK